MVAKDRVRGLHNQNTSTLKFKLENEPQEYTVEREKQPHYYGRDIKSIRLRKMAYRSRVNASFDRLKTKEWPAEMQPSAETVSRAESLWRAVQGVVSNFDLDAPNVSAADDNSVDVFWGDKHNRVLLNIPSSTDEMLFLHFVGRSGQTVINFTDSHQFNIINLLREMRGALD